MYSTIEDLTPGLAILGHIKIGRKGEKRVSKSGGTYSIPQKLDHFVITHRERGSDDNFIVDETLTKKIGGEVREINIRLLFDDIELNFPHRLACYVTQSDLKKHFGIESRSKRCYCTGNGREATRLQKDGSKETMECNPLACEIYNGQIGDIKCKALARLIFTLPDMDYVGGCYDFVTSSMETIRNIKGSILYILQKTQGILAGIPLQLRMYAATDESEKGQVKNWKVTIVYAGKEEQLIDIVKQIAHARSRSYVDIKRLQIEAQKAIEYIENAEEGDIAEEFYPPKPEPNYQCDGELLRKINDLAMSCGYNSAKTIALLGEYKGREGELKDKLVLEFNEKEKAALKGVESPGVLDSVVSPAGCKPVAPGCEGAIPSTPTNEPEQQSLPHQPEQQRQESELQDEKGKERQDIVNSISDFKGKMTPADFKKIRSKYPKVAAMSMQELKALEKELRGNNG